MRVGFIGLGVMGQPMARRLLQSGLQLAVWARRPESAAMLTEDGAILYATPEELAAASDVVITMVTTDRDVEALAEKLMDGFRPGAVHVDMSTISPTGARALAERYYAHELGWVDAPVSGGEPAAQAGTLAIMAGGEVETFKHVRPVLERLGNRIVHVGPAGAGQVAKACNQMIMVSALEACAEAMRLAQASGVEPGAVRNALLGGSAASRVLEVFGERMVRRDFAAGVQARLHHKDFGILMREAAAIGAPLPVAAQVWQQLNALMGLGWGMEDTACLLKVLEPTRNR